MTNPKHTNISSISRSFRFFPLLPKYRNIHRAEPEISKRREAEIRLYSWVDAVKFTSCYSYGVLKPFFEAVLAKRI